MQRDPVPEGFTDPAVGGFVGHLGPIYRKDYDGQVLSGFIVEERHCNPSGACHGGWLSTFADVSLAREAGHGGSSFVTMSLTVDFLRPIRLGSWVESRCDAVRRTHSTCFLQGVATVHGEPVLRLNGIFRLVREKT